MNTLEACVNSVLQQTYTMYELVLVDDGSNDGSDKLLADLQRRDERIRIFHHENQGVSFTRNRGVSESRGDYIVFVDSDDIIPNNYLESLIKTAEAGFFAWCSCELFNPRGLPTGKTDFSKYGHTFTKKDIMKLSKMGLLNAPWCKLFDARVIKQNGIAFPENMQIAEDLDFNLQYLAAESRHIMVTNETAYHYIRYDNSLDNKYISDYWEIHRNILTKEKKLAEEWEISEEDWNLYYERYWDYVSHALYNTMLEKNVAPLKDKLKQNNTILKEKEVRTALRKSKGRTRKREYCLFYYFNYSIYYRIKKIVGK